MINPRAIRDLDNIYEYFANEKLAPENAKGQVNRIKKASQSVLFAHFIHITNLGKCRAGKYDAQVQAA